MQRSQNDNESRIDWGNNPPSYATYQDHTTENSKEDQRSPKVVLKVQRDHNRHQPQQHLANQAPIRFNGMGTVLTVMSRDHAAHH